MLTQRALQREMTNESSSYLSVAMTTDGIDERQSADGKNMMSLFVSRLAVVILGIVGTAGNGLILYALFASKQHKKHLLIVNQNVLDLFASFCLSLTYLAHMSKISLIGQRGYWLCTMVLSGSLIWWGTNGSMINLALITVDRYLMVVHPVSSKKWLRPWVIYSAVATAWLLAIVYNTVLVFYSTEVIDGQCVPYVIADDAVANLAAIVAYVVFFYIIILALFIVCYWRILITVRRQAKVMASHSAAGTTSELNCE